MRSPAHRHVLIYGPELFWPCRHSEAPRSTRVTDQPCGPLLKMQARIGPFYLFRNFNQLALPPSALCQISRRKEAALREDFRRTVPRRHRRRRPAKSANRVSLSLQCRLDLAGPRPKTPRQLARALLAWRKRRAHLTTETVRKVGGQAAGRNGRRAQRSATAWSRSKVPFATAVRTNIICAPRGDQRICCFAPIRR